MGREYEKRGEVGVEMDGEGEGVGDRENGVVEGGMRMRMVFRD